MKTVKFRIIIFVLAFSCCLHFCYAQKGETKTDKNPADAFDIKNSSFLLPQPLPKGKYHHAIAVHYVIVPKDWALDNIQAPFFNYSAKYTLPSGFNVQGSLSTLFISNRINAGPFWNYSLDNYHVGVGYQVAFEYGVLNQFGFKSSIQGWGQQPSITIGYSFRKSAIVLRTDLYYTNVLHLTEGGNTITSSHGFANGHSLTTSLEERLWGNRLFSFGVKVAHIKYHIVAWPAFPVNQYRYYVPEFQFGLKF